MGFKSFIAFHILYYELFLYYCHETPKHVGQFVK
jgi:hypothetical protein